MKAAVCAVLLGIASAAAVLGDPAADAIRRGLTEARRGSVTSAGSFYVEWWTEPTPLPLNEMFNIHFRVLEARDRTRPVASAVVTATAWMPEHNHGTALEPHVESHGDGTATGEGFLLQMEGHWELRVGVAAKGQMERAVFSIDIGP